MHSADAAILLTRAGLVDGRLRMTDDDLAAKARYWAEVLADTTLEEGLAALVEHHRTMTTPPLPAHLLAHVRVARQRSRRAVDVARQQREVEAWRNRREFTDEERAAADRAFADALAQARAARRTDTGVDSPP